MDHHHVDFENPPLVEVSIGIQFSDLPIRTAHIGDFRDLYIEQLQLTEYEEQQPLEPREEVFEPTPRHFPGIRIESLPPLPRQWFSSEDGTKLVQLQRDRLIYNWRRTPNDEYPRYPMVKQGFEECYHCFVGGVQQMFPTVQPEIEITQCEIAYFNHIESKNVWSSHSDVDKVIEPLNLSALQRFNIEDTRFGFRAQLLTETNETFGRVYVNVTPAFRSSDGAPLVSVDLTARGKPDTNDLTGALNFFDHGHREITTLFAELTTSTMHDVWGRQK